MKHLSQAPIRKGTLVAMALLTALATTFPSAAQPWAARDPEPEPSELIVLLAAGSPTPEQVVEETNSGRAFSTLPGTEKPQAGRLLIPERAQGAARDRLAADPSSPEAVLQRYLVLTFPASTDLDSVGRKLALDPSVLWVGPNRKVELSVTPNDPLFAQLDGQGNPLPPDQHQWGPHSLHLPEAWDLNLGHAYIGITDTGITTSHLDHRPVDSSGHFVGGNFRPQLSYDYGYNDDNVDEGQSQVEGGVLRTVVRGGHGTHVAGIAAGSTNNGLGIAGTCQSCSLLISKISRLGLVSTPPAGYGNYNIYVANWVAGINGAIQRGAQILSMSLGLRPEAQDCAADPLDPLCQAIDLADDRDIAVAASAGNDGLNVPDFPASDSRVFGVGGIKPDGQFWLECPGSECGSNYQADQFVMPAKQVISTFSPGLTYNPAIGCDQSLLPAFPGYGPCTGTSMSAPAMAGSLGLLRSVNPLLAKNDLRDLLMTNLDNPPGWNPQFGLGKPNVAAAVQTALGVAAGKQIPNRLTPLFTLYSDIAGVHVSTTVPQLASAAILDPVVTYYPSAGLTVGGYPEFPDTGCVVGPCFPIVPLSSVFIFTGHPAPFAGAPALVPLYRMSRGAPLNRTYVYTTENQGLDFFYLQDFDLDGIEGYIHPRCTPEPSCIPEGAVRLYRLYNSALDDYAIFPESELTTYQANGYASQPGLNDWIGYAYPNLDSDADFAIDGFENLVGTNPLVADTDCDGASDGDELLVYDTHGYGDPLAGPCTALNVHISDTFTGSGALNGRLSEIGAVAWSSNNGAVISNRVLDLAAIAGVPFVASSLPPGTTVELTTDADPFQTGAILVGFTDQAASAFWASGQLWVSLSSNNTYAVHGVGQQLAAGTIPGIATNGFHRIAIRYTRGSDLAVVLLNNVQVFSQTLAATPNIQFAGFHMHQATEGGDKIDNFVLTRISAPAAVLISDTFTGNGALDGRLTPVGGVIWSARAGALLSGGVVIDSGAIAGVPFRPADLDGQATVSVEADADPTASSWIGVGFANQATGPYWSAGKLWALVNSTGGYKVFALGVAVASGTIPGTPTNGYHHIEVVYNTVNRRAKVRFNGVEVYDQILAAAPDIQFAGFHMYQAADSGGKVDNFKVLATAAP